MITYTVPKEFIAQRNERAKKYNRRDRSESKHLMDIDAELYEYYCIHEQEYINDDRWEVDMLHGSETIDCKCIDKYYNISQYKMCYLLRQHGVTDTFEFWEWSHRPPRPLQENDEVMMNPLIRLDYWDVMKNIQPSKFNQGYYVDIRKML